MKTRAWIIVCFAAIAIGVSGALATERVEATSNANMRAQPNNSAPVVSSIPRGAVADVVDREGAWLKIRYNGKNGWIFGSLTQPVRSRASEVFTKQDDITMPPPVPVDDKAEADTAEADKEPRARYAQINQDNTSIFERLDPRSPIIAKAKRGQVFELAGVGGSGVWCVVVVGDTTGWVRCSSIDIHNERPTEMDTLASDATAWFTALLVGGVLILAFSIFITIRHIREERKRNVFVKKNALILAKESKLVQYMLTNAEAPMERCFTEIGFSVSVAKDSVTARSAIEHDLPDIILVDWDFEPAIYTKIDSLFARMIQAGVTQKAPYFLFYNVPDPSAAPPAKALQHVSFLGLNVSDRDIFKVVTPLIVNPDAESPKNVHKSVQRCALEGQIDGENLLEVLQFIDVGSRTGCLMIETKGPFGLVYFRDGMIVYAAAAKGQGKGQGVEAVYSILNQPTGKFRFITNKHPKTANLCLPTLSVLMEWTKEKDEARRG